jgi:hypothetical protein
MKKWIPILTLISGWLAGSIDPQITHAVATWSAHHTELAITLAGFVGAVYHGLPAPPSVTKAVQAPAAIIRKQDK